MYVHNQKVAGQEVQELRRAGGRWLREMRQRRGLSQRQMAAAVGAEYYTFISQLENGRGRIPPDRYRAWAEALDVPPSTFVYNLMRFYDPVTHEILFDEDGRFGGDASRFRPID
jgi:transcriptional regulator with XRE-family HTH domain